MMAAFNFQAMPPEEAAKYLRSKGFAIGFSWKDIERDEHAIAFTVAKAMQVDILNDIRNAVEWALTNGKTFSDFQKELTPILQERGWWGQKKVVDPLDGKSKRVQLGSPRRLQIIYDTNIRMAHAAGRWSQIQRTKKRFPYLRYIAVLDERTRPGHRRWHSIILPADHPFWNTHYPPNGWRCRCIVQQVSEAQMKRKGWSVTDKDTLSKFQKEMEIKNNRTGEIRSVPLGIDPGFDYNVGKARMKAFTPPPAGGIPSTFPTGLIRDQLPPATKATKSQILPEGQPAEYYVGQFLDKFGADSKKPIIHMDKAGSPLTISEDLFKNAQGELKAEKFGRHIYLPLLAQTILNPDEIWMIWERINNDWRLRRRYLKHWDVEGEKKTGIGVFEFSKDSWFGSTLFQGGQKTDEARSRYLEKQRNDLLMYRRIKK